VHTVTFEMETVTPLFMGGADPRGMPELRAPSLRGVLRFWFRALIGQINPELQKLEAEVFGNQEHASPVRVRVYWDWPPSVKRWDPPGWPPESGGGISSRTNGLVYLGFAFRRTKGEVARRAIDAGWRFQVEMSSGDRKALRKAWACLWALSRFGGLGSRSRRGFGAVRVVGGPEGDDLGPDLPSMVVQARTPQELALELSQGLSKAVGVLGAGPASPHAQHFTLRSGTARAWVLGHTWPRWHTALRDLGEALAQFRRPMEPTMATVLQGGRPNLTLERPSFGLPIVYYNPASRQSVTLEAVTARGERISRRASPLVLRPLLLADGKVACLLVVSLAPLLPLGAKLKAGPREILGDLNAGGVGKFIQWCRNKWGLHEVKLP